MLELSRVFGKTAATFLRDAYLYGSAPAKASGCKVLLNAGIMAIVRMGNQDRVVLDPRHPATAEICELIQSETDATRGDVPPVKLDSPHQISPEQPLGVRGNYGIRILMTLMKFGPITIDEIHQRNRDLWKAGLCNQIAAFLKSALLTKRENVISIALDVPPAYLGFVGKVWAALEGTDHGYPAFSDAALTPRAWAYKNAADGAPRMFGTDARLRNLMALAKYGPLHLLELRRIVGLNSTHRDDQDNAPLMRSGMALTWGTTPDHAAMLDPRFPLHAPLMRFLLAMEKAYPLPPYMPARPAPPLPKISGNWKGDRHWVFGGPVPTAILTSIGVHGWTFEALCVPLATGHDRVVVKKCVARLEKEGVLQGDRERKPGFNVRRLTIAENFPARNELIALLEAYLKAFPAVKSAVDDAMNKLEPRTKEHLRRRGLVPCYCHPNGGHRPSNTAEHAASRVEKPRGRRKKPAG